MNARRTLASGSPRRPRRDVRERRDGKRRSSRPENCPDNPSPERGRVATDSSFLCAISRIPRRSRLLLIGRNVNRRATVDNLSASSSSLLAVARGDSHWIVAVVLCCCHDYCFPDGAHLLRSTTRVGGGAFGAYRFPGSQRRLENRLDY